MLALRPAGAADSPTSNLSPAEIAAEQARQVAPDLAMAVRGTIDVAADGSLIGYNVADEQRIPQNVRGLIAQTAAAWRFNPLPADDQQAPRHAFMELTIGANQLEDGSYLVFARDAYFHTGETRTLDRNSGIKQSRPAYPDYALRKNISGTVHLILKADLEGNILDVVARRVDLDATRPKREEDRGREVLAKAAIRAARQWHAPAPGWPEDGPGYRVIAARMVFSFVSRSDSFNKDNVGKWGKFNPGPLASAHWIDEVHPDWPAPPISGGSGDFLPHPTVRLMTPVAGI